MLYNLKIMLRNLECNFTYSSVNIGGLVFYSSISFFSLSHVSCDRTDSVWVTILLLCSMIYSARSFKSGCVLIHDKYLIASLS